MWMNRLFARSRAWSVCDVLGASKRVLHHLLKFVDDMNSSLFNCGLSGILELRRCNQAVTRESSSTIWAVQVIGMIGKVNLEVLFAAWRITCTADKSVGIGRYGYVKRQAIRQGIALSI